MNKRKIPQELYNLLDLYRMLSYIAFLKVSKSYGIILNGLKINKDACIGNVSKNIVTYRNLYFRTCSKTLHYRGKFQFAVYVSHSTGLTFLRNKSFGKFQTSCKLEKCQEVPKTFI